VPQQSDDNGGSGKTNKMLREMTTLSVASTIANFGGQSPSADEFRNDLNLQQLDRVVKVTGQGRSPLLRFEPHAIA